MLRLAPRRRSLAPLLLAAPLILSTPAAAATTVQVNRADGPAGAFPLEASTSITPTITDDGATVYTGFKATAGSWAQASGIYRRDLATKKTTRIALSPSWITGLTADGRTLSFITPLAVDPTDRNGKPDIYAYDAPTGAVKLVSRADGAAGAALGVTSTGFVTRGGRYAIFGTSTGVGLRDLTANTTIRVATGNLGSPANGTSGYTRSDALASADGTVFVNDAILRTPGGARTIAGFEAPYTQVKVSESGTAALWVDSSALPTTVRLMNTATGATSAPNATDPANPSAGQMTPVALSPDGTEAYLQAFVADPTGALGGNPFKAIRKLTFATGAVSSVGLSSRAGITAISRTARFGVISDSPQRIALATAGTGQTLPGAIDPPSPHLYLSHTPGCRRLVSAGRKPLLKFEQVFDAPKVTAVDVKVYNAGGTLVHTWNGNTELALNVGYGAYRIVSTLTLEGGTTINETSYQPALATNNLCPNSAW